MVQAAAEGIVDFSQTRFQDFKWNWRLTRLLEYVKRKNDRHRNQLMLTRLMASLSQRLPADLRQQILEHLNELQQKIDYAFEPSAYALIAEQSSPAQRVRQGAAAWEEEFGALADPRIQQEIDRVAAGLMALTQDNNRRLRDLPDSLKYFALHR